MRSVVISNLTIMKLVITILMIEQFEGAYYEH